MITEELKNKIIKEVKVLKDVDDCTGVKISNDKGVFIQVVEDYIDGELYFVELNDIDESNDGWYPCKGYIAYASLGDMEELIEVIEMLKDIEERTLKEYS